MIVCSQAIRANFGHADLKQLLQDIEAVLDDDAQVYSPILYMSATQQLSRARVSQQDRFSLADTV